MLNAWCKVTSGLPCPDHPFLVRHPQYPYPPFSLLLSFALAELHERSPFQHLPPDPHHLVQLRKPAPPVIKYIYHHSQHTFQWQPHKISSKLSNMPHVYYICRTICVIQVYIIQCITHVSGTHVIHLYFYMCNTPKTPHMYYRYGTIGHVYQQDISRVSWCARICPTTQMSLHKLCSLTRD